jgi:hypothetical protein
VEALKQIVRRSARQPLLDFNFDKDKDWKQLAGAPQFKELCGFIGLSYQLSKDSDAPETERA